LIDDDLSGVGKIAKLRFPHHQGIRRGQAVSVFETKPVTRLVLTTYDSNIVLTRHTR
jgi:hypothetical protein